MDFKKPLRSDGNGPHKLGTGQQVQQLELAGKSECRKIFF